jgi:hypothetical protein
MLEEVKIDPENQIMRVQFGSDSTVENWKRALVQVEHLSEETGICRLLVDVKKQAELASTMTLFDFASNLPRSIAFAILCELHLDNHRFIENVATNRCIAVKDFDSEKSAIEWLKNRPNKSIGNDNK